uniref:Late embryogenesis abundant n=1 Tax=Cleistogenes songorica TaxID=121774 RepID=A0A2S1WLS1_9POAL|nr:late embryogenesis abundant [Cleistogenes songorica]
MCVVGCTPFPGLKHPTETRPASARGDKRLFCNFFIIRLCSICKHFSVPSQRFVSQVSSQQSAQASRCSYVRATVTEIGQHEPGTARPHRRRVPAVRRRAGGTPRARQVITRGQEQHDGGLHVTETDISAGRRMVTANAGGQVIAQFTVPVPDKKVAEAMDAATVGEAAEMRATGRAGNVPGGVAAAAQRAAEEEDGEVTRLRDVVGDAAAVMPANKVATREDAEKVAAAARRNAGAPASGGGWEGVVQAVAGAADMTKGG